MQEIIELIDERVRVSRGNILIVDDDRDTCNLLCAVFGDKGYETSVAYSGEEALDQIETSEPDLMVLDVMMPGMDGWETLERIRAKSKAPAPVLFLTALDSGQDAARALAMGAGDYVRKPVHRDEILARVESLIRGPKAKGAFADSRDLLRQLPDRPTVSVVIPTLNEAKNLPLVLPYLPFDMIDEVVVVDGGSTDGTVEMARQLVPSVNIVTQERPGKGAALLAGYGASTGDIIVSMDADGSNDPREIPRFIEVLMQGAEMAKGTRFAPGGGTTDMPRYRRFGNSVFVTMVNWLFNGTFTDLCYGYNAFWRECQSLLGELDAEGFEIEAAIYTRALERRLRIAEVPSFEGYRFHGVGKLRTIPDGLRVLRTIAFEYLKRSGSAAFEPRVGFGQSPLPSARTSSFGKHTERVPGVGKIHEHQSPRALGIHGRPSEVNR